MALKKTPIFWVGFLTIIGITIYGLLARLVDVALAGLTAIIWAMAVGLGANVGHSLQRSAFYKPELDEKRGANCADKGTPGF
jgi:hypothetical protein